MFKIILLMIIVYLNIFSNINAQCDLKTASQKEKDLLKRLDPLFKKNYVYTDSKYSYFLGICDKPVNSTNQNDSKIGLVQERADNKIQYALGRLKDVDLEGSDNWIRMVYRNGDNYGSACNGTQRKAAVLILCDQNAKGDGEFSIVEENTDRDIDCSYVFQLTTKLICLEQKQPDPNQPPVIAPTTTLATTAKQMSDSKAVTSGFGIFGIICLIIFSVAAIYLIGGVLFMRLVRNQRGVHQIPNFRFWNRIGNFQADLCDYFCRCNGATETNAQPYESLSGQLSDDENMLNV